MPSLDLYTKINGEYIQLSAVMSAPNLEVTKKLLIFVAIGQYVAQHTSKKKSKFTRNNEKKYFSDLYEFCCRKELIFCDEIKTIHLQEYKNEMLKRVKPSTVNRQFNTIKHFFNLLLKREIIVRNPCLILTTEKIEKPQIDLWTARDFIRAKNGLEESVQNMLYFMWYCGARSCEAVNFMWTDINYDEGVFYLRSDKNSNVTRAFPLTNRISKLLHTMKMRGLYVFGGGSKFTSDSLGKKVKKSVLKNCVNKKLTVKGLRHTFCTRLIEKNIENATVQELMGHASWKTTENYKHLSKKHLKETAEKI